MSPRQLRQESSDIVTLYMSLVPFLRENSPVSVADTARHFGVSQKIIIDAVNNLYFMGPFNRSGVIPGGGMFDFDMDLFDEGRGDILVSQTPSLERTPRLSAQETTTILAGLQILRAASEPETRDVIDSLVKKISAARGSNSSPMIVKPVTPPPVIVEASAAISEGHQIRIVYANPDGSQTERTIDPLRIDFVGSTWYLRGWCHLREARRTFRADRVISHEHLDSAISTKSTEDLLQDSLFDESDTDLVATVSMPAWVFPFVSDYDPKLIDTTPSGDLVLEVRFAGVRNAVRFVCRHPGHIRVLEPESLRNAIAQWAVSRG